MSRFGRFVRRAAHDFGDQVDRSAHQVGSQVKRTAKQFGNFTQRAVRGVEGYTGRLGQQFGGFQVNAVQQVEHDFKRSVVYTAQFSPYITAVAAFIVNLVPVIGWILGAVVVAVGTFANRWGGYYAGRIKGMTTQEARDYGRTIARRNLESGLIGNALGGIVAAFGVTFAAGGADAAADASLMAGEAGEFNSANLALQGGESLEAEASANVLNTITNAEYAAGGTNFAAELLPTNYALSEALASGSNFLTSAWNLIAENPEKLLTGAYSVYSQVVKKLTPPSFPAMNFAFPVGGSVGSGDPGGPGPGGGGGGISWDDAAEAVEGFFAEYGQMLAIGLGIALLLALFLR